MSRFFAFGCSFTKYKWLTWADLISDQFDEYQNWGKTGAGNHFILNSLIECHQRNKLTKDDTVIICWTNVDREDRYIHQWVTPGNIYTQTTYPDSWVKEFVTEKGCLVRDLALIKASKMILDHIGCHYEFISMVPFNYSNYKKHLSDNGYVLDLYKDVLQIIKPSFFETIFNYDWTSKRDNKWKLKDYHPLPVDHAEYVNNFLPNFKLSSNMQELAIKESHELLINEKFVSTVLSKSPLRF